MLAIIPDYDGSDSENNSESDDEIRCDEQERRMKSKDSQTSDTRCHQERSAATVVNTDCNNLKISPEREARDVKCEDSSLTPEQASAVRYLALKRRRDEELKALEEANQSERRRESRKRRKRKGQTSEDLPEDPTKPGSSIDQSEDMKNLSTYIGVNDHLKGSLVDHGDLAPKSGLEKEIDEAVAAGDVDKAERLSNYLASRNFAVRITEAANARDYAEQKKEEEQQKLARKKLKKAKLAWGFEVKHRWEMKGNM